MTNPVNDIELRIGMLRQWLNEDRITDPKKMVTNEDIHHWLDAGINSKVATETQKAQTETHTQISKAIDELSCVVDTSPEASKASEILRELLPSDWYTFKELTKKG